MAAGVHVINLRRRQVHYVFDVIGAAPRLRQPQVCRVSGPARLRHVTRNMAANQLSAPQAAVRRR